MGNQRFRRICAMLLIFMFILLTASCDLEPAETSESHVQESEATGVSDITGDLSFPPEENRTEWVFEDGDEQATLSARYEDMPLSRVMEFSGALAKDDWLLSGNSAYKGALSLSISYAMDTRRLHLEFVLDKTKAEWPEQALTPYLAYQTPAFPFGEYSYCEVHRIDETEDTTLIVYREVNADEIDAYERMLLDGGYVRRNNSGAALYEKGFCFVEISYHALGREVSLIVGQYQVYASALPPWPDPLPEEAKRILPPVSAAITVTESEDAYFASVQQASLFDLYGFFQDAMEYYDWPALSPQDDMAHADPDFGMRMLSFSTDTSVWTLTIYRT